MTRVLLPVVVISLLVGCPAPSAWAQGVLPITDGLVGWWDASDASTLENAAGVNPGAAGFDNMVVVWRDKALVNGAQDASIDQSSKVANAPTSDVPFTYSDGTGGAFNTGAPYISSDESNSLGFDDLQISTTSVFYVINAPGEVDNFSSSENTHGASIGQMTLDGKGTIVWDRSSLLSFCPFDQDVAIPKRPLMVGMRGEKEFLSAPDVFLSGEPVIINWTYGGGDTTAAGLDDPNSFKFYKDGVPWGPIATCGGIGGSATDNRIGREGFSGLAADWGEVLIYDDVLTSDERSQVTDYLSDKYGIVQPFVFDDPKGYAQHVHNSRPAAYFRFEENPTTGTAIDSYDFGGVHDGTYQGGVSSVSGANGNTTAGDGRNFIGLVDANRAASFDGSTGRVEVADPDGRLDTNGNFITESGGSYSFEFLMQTAAGGEENQAIVSKGNFSDNTSTFMSRVGEQIAAGLNSGVAAFAQDIPVGEWTHVVGTFNPSFGTTEILLYLNGEPSEPQVAFELQVKNPGEPLIIGAHDVNSFVNHFNGAIDELAVYTRALSDREIADHYEALFEQAGEPYVPGGGPEPQFQPGDANGDFSVDTADIIAVLAAAKFETGEEATFAQGDFNGDGVFNTADIVAMLGVGLFETGPYEPLAAVSNAGAGSAGRVPEPATVGLLLMGILIVAASRRRYRG